MIKEVKMYSGYRGKDANEGTDYSCWGDESQAEEVATNSDWLKEEDKHYCPDCYFYDDGDNLILRKIDLQSKK